MTLRWCLIQREKKGILVGGIRGINILSDQDTSQEINVYIHQDAHIEATGNSAKDCKRNYSDWGFQKCV